MTKGPGPKDWARVASRSTSQRAMRRAAEAMERKSIPQLKKEIRRRQGK